MKKLNKKGFTIVELVIVIAVIAILAAVLIPTFSGVIEKAQKSANDQDAANTYKQLLTEDDYIGNLNLNPTADAIDLYIVVGEGVVYKVIDGDITVANIAEDQIETEAVGTAGTDYYKKLTGDYDNVYVFEAKQTAAPAEGN